VHVNTMCNGYIYSRPSLHMDTDQWIGDTQSENFHCVLSNAFAGRLQISVEL
jgi:hypothetical protein